jgi:hypothetical protein
MVVKSNNGKAVNSAHISQLKLAVMFLLFKFGRLGGDGGGGGVKIFKQNLVTKLEPSNARF